MSLAFENGRLKGTRYVVILAKLSCLIFLYYKMLGNNLQIYIQLSNAELLCRPMGACIKHVFMVVNLLVYKILWYNTHLG